MKKYKFPLKINMLFEEKIINNHKELRQACNDFNEINNEFSPFGMPAPMSVDEFYNICKPIK